MGLNFGSDEIDSLALGDTPLEALMLGEVELWTPVKEVVVIDGTNWMAARSQFRDALTALELDYTTVTTLPFLLDIQATDIQGLFDGCSSLTEAPEMDTSNVTNMMGMFRYCSSLTNVPEMDTSNVTSMDTMFQDCTSLTEVPPMDTSNVTDTSSMFDGCSSLTEVPEMDTSKVTDMYRMFRYCSSLTTVPPMDTSNVTDMGSMFSGCSSLTYVPDMVTSNVTDMNYMFQGCRVLTDGNVRLIGRHPSVTTSYMISSSGLTAEPFYTQDVVIDATGSTGARDQFRAALAVRGLNYQTVETIPFLMDTSQATTLNSLFEGCAALTSAPEMDTSNVTNMIRMFQDCTSLTEVPEMDTSNVTTMYNMFWNCTSLTEVPEMDTSNVTTMYGMFWGCSSLTYVPDMETSNVTNMNSMFRDCSSLTDGNVRLFGKHPDVETTSMIYASGLTVEPFYFPAVETTTTLTVEPEEIEEGESVTLTATVTPAEAVGEVTFVVGALIQSVNVVNGEAVITVTLDMEGKHDIVAGFTPANEADFLPSMSAIGSVTVTEPAPAGIVPMSWSGGTSNTPDSLVEVVNATVVGSGEAIISASFESWGVNNKWRYMYLYVNDVEVYSFSELLRETQTLTFNWTGSLSHGDNIRFVLRVDGPTSRFNSWSLIVASPHPLSFSETEPRTLPSNTIVALWEEVVPEPLTADILLSWDWDVRGSTASTNTRWIELRLNGSRVQQWSQQLTSSYNDNLPWTDSATISSQALQAGDVLQVRASGSYMPVGGRTIKSWSIIFLSGS